MKRILCLALVLLMLLPMVISCAKDEGEGAETGAATTGGDVAGGGEEEKIDLLTTIPTANYNGRKFIMTVQSQHEAQIKADELTGETANDTVFAWLSKIETVYGVDVMPNVPAEGEAYFTAVTNENSSGMAVKTAIYGHNAFELYKVVTQGAYKNWLDMGDMIDLKADRWDQIINDDATYNGVLYGLTGDLGYSKLQGAMATYFNIALLDEIGYSDKDLYKMVDDMEWTFDIFYNIVKQVYIDTDDNGKKSYGDTFGYVTISDNSHDIWLTQFGIGLTSRDAENKITPTLHTPDNINVIDMLISFYHENEGIASYTAAQTNKIYEDDYFSEGRAAMITTRLSYAKQFAEDLGVDEYGILPGPLRNEDQPEYLTKLFEQYAIWCVGKSILDEDKDFIAHITDALCAESSQTLYPKFYDILMKQRYSKDPDTARMVDTVMKNQSLDSVYMFGKWLNAYPHIPRDCYRNAKSLAEAWGAIEENLPGKLEDMYEFYK